MTYHIHDTDPILTTLWIRMRRTAVVPTFDEHDGRWYTWPGTRTDNPRIWSQLAVIMSVG